MPRNPDKTRCTIPGCRNWAMRNHDHCRAHRDELGPSGAGPPPGNLNALKLGAHAHPLPTPELERLAEIAIGQPQDLPLQLGLVLQAIQSRTNDTFLALVALRALLIHLTNHVAVRLFSAELHDLLAPLPLATDHLFRSLVEQQTAHDSPPERLLNLRKMRTRLKQLPEQGKKP